MWRRHHEPCPSASSTWGRTRSGSTSSRTATSCTARRRCSGSASRSSASASIPADEARRDGRLRRAASSRRPGGRRRAARGARHEPGPPGRERRGAARPPRCRSGVPVRLLSAERRAGSPSSAHSPRRARHGPRLIAVCDVGGGSAQVAVGTRRDGVAWVRSIDIGSMRLTSRLLDDDPPGDAAVEAARVEVDRLLEGFAAAAARDRARRRRQRPRAALDRRRQARRRRARRGDGDPRPHAGAGDRRSSTASTSSGCARSPRARSSSARSASGSHVRSASCGGGVREGAAIELAQRRAKAA